MYSGLYIKIHILQQQKHGGVRNKQAALTFFLKPKNDKSTVQIFYHIVINEFVDFNQILVLNNTFSTHNLQNKVKMTLEKRS